MTELDPLIRLRRHTVEEKQKFLSALYREAELLEAKKRSLEDQLDNEKKIALAQGTPDASADYGRYAENVRKKIGKFAEALKKMENRINGAQEDVRAAFAEMKKIEIIQRNRQDAERKDVAEKESDMLDEIAIDGFRRKGDLE